MRDGDEYVVNGQKIWSTWANRADWGILLARTDPTRRKHTGISYFVVDMHSPGIEVRPIIEMTGGNHFNETFLTDVRIPATTASAPRTTAGAWRKVTLGNERVSLSEGGVLWGMGPESADLFDVVARRGRHRRSPASASGPRRVWTETTILRLLGQRILTSCCAAATLARRRRSARPWPTPRPARHGTAQGPDRARRDARHQGPDAEELDVWHWGYLFSRALTIGGGTSEVQRNIIGERVLGLPREPT